MEYTEASREQETDCAFWRVDMEAVGNGADHVTMEPVDDHAVYGWASLGDRQERDIDVPVRCSTRDLVTAIRCVDTDDRVRVNDGGWMSVVDSRFPAVDEGFAAVYDDGSVVYTIEPMDGPRGEEGSSWMRRLDDGSSVHEVHCLEVDWEASSE